MFFADAIDLSGTVLPLQVAQMFPCEREGEYIETSFVERKGGRLNDTIFMRGVVLYQKEKKLVDPKKREGKESQTLLI